ncbi:MAG TPA: hypothetical protein VGB15_05960 [Longimicrobium sp.]
MEARSAVRAGGATAQLAIHTPRTEDAMTGKLKLDLDRLKVESFEAQAPLHERGTVDGAEYLASIDGTCIDATCRNYGSCRPQGCATVP